MKHLIFFLFIVSLLACPSTPIEIEQEGFTSQLQSNVVGLTPRELLTNDSRFTKSQYLNPLPILSQNFPYTTVNPNSYRNWQECINANTKIKLLPGDYTGWGVLKTNKQGTFSNPIIIRYSDESQPSAYKRKQTNNEAVIEGFKLENTQHIILTGLTIRGRGDSKDGVIGGIKNAIFDCKNIVVDFCNFENVVVTGIRMVNAENCIMQNNVFQQFNPELNGDGGAIGIQSTRDKASIGNIIVNNEIINYNDGLGFPREGNPQGLETDLTGDVSGNVIENNDIYITSLLYTPDGNACAENAMDFKTGTKTINKNLVINNRMFGNRPTGSLCSSSGSNGCFVSLHRNASGLTFKGNVFFDGAVGFNILQSDNKFPDESMINLIIQNNLLFDLNHGQSAGFIMANTATIGSNTVKNAQDGVFISNPKASVANVKKNVFISIKNIVPELATTNKYITGITYKDYSFYCKRWTSPTLVTAKNVLK